MENQDKVLHVFEMQKIIVARCKHKEAMDRYYQGMADLRRLQALHTEDGGVPRQIEERIEETKIFIKEGQEYMARIEKIAEVMIVDSPMLNKIWTKERSSSSRLSSASTSIGSLTEDKGLDDVL